MASLKPGQKLGMQSRDGNDFEAQLKKIKGSLIAVSVTSGLRERASLSIGKILKIATGAKDAGKIPAVVKQDKAFPLLILSLETSRRRLKRQEKGLEEEDIEDLIASITDPEFIGLRDSARSEDSFPIEFYKQSHERAEQKKNEYLIRPSHERREAAKQHEQAAGFNESELRPRMAHLDPALQGIILDLYRRVTQIPGGMAPLPPSQPDDEAIGICVDISGTGLRFLTSQRLKSGDILKVMISPSLASPPFSISALVQVKRVTRVKNPDPPHKKYSVGVKYYAMHEGDMEQITAYTFKLQRDQLQLKRQLKSA